MNLYIKWVINVEEMWNYFRKKEDGNPYYSAFSTEQEPASLASKKRWLPPSMGGLRTCETDPTTDCSL